MVEEEEELQRERERECARECGCGCGLGGLRLMPFDDCSRRSLKRSSREVLATHATIANAESASRWRFAFRFDRLRMRETAEHQGT
jgi:hypothetical protein